MNPENFTGIIKINFDLIHVSTDTFLDFNNKSIDSLTINGTKIDSVQWNNLFITLPAATLKLEKNCVEIVFSCNYANDGSGLHSFVDTDGKQYLYS